MGTANQEAIKDGNITYALIAHDGTADTANTQRVVADASGAISTTVIGTVDTNNSSTVSLGTAAVYTGTATNISSCGIIFVNVYSDQASATDGLSIQQSSDATNWDHADDYTVPAASGKNYSINPHAKWMRVVYTNGTVAQTEFRLQTICKGNSKPSSHRIQDAIVDDDDSELVKAVLTGKNGSDVFRNVQVTQDGDLKISDNSSGLSIAQGNVTGATFIHKFGQAPDFDTGDGFVTIWDGADDSLLTGAAMNYTYSSTDDIGLISSSSSSDTGDIEIQGLDGDGNLVTQTITLNGQTDVDISGVGGTDLKRVFRMKNVGSSDFVGDIYLRTNGSGQSGGVPSTPNTVRAIVNNGNNQTLMAIYTIPTGKTGYMRDWYANTAGASKNSNYVIKLLARPSGEVFQLKHISALNETGTSALQHMYTEPEVFSAGTDIEMQTNVTAVGVTVAAVGGGFDIVLIDD